MKERHEGLDTRCVHAGEPRPGTGGAVIAPIFQSATYEYTGEQDYNLVRYTRLNNTPNQLALGEKLASLEGAEAAVVTASGMAAISTALLALVGEGETLLAQDTLYGGTFHFLHESFEKLGRKVRFFPLERAASLEELVTPTTRAVYVESISNPLLRVPDLAAVAELARRRGLVSFIDNTFPSPVNFTPAALGYDVILHSATKYLNGHTDVVAGCVVGRARHVEAVTKLLNILGGSMDPHACFLLNRGMKTLGVRVRQQNATALALAQALEKHPRVERVIYPGLASHPDHDRARSLFRGFGGMLSFEYRGLPAEADAALKRLRLPSIAPSLGGVESLVTRPVTTSHSGVPPEERARQGIRDTLVRVSVGLEDAADLIADFAQALDGK